ncbi:MAG: hypothetical protein KGI60_01380 [Patescibacteria group bacterium]|nr:hypothetical protein [Patescibacteria group bacterium]
MNKKNFELDSRSEELGVLHALERRATKKRAKILLPGGNRDFGQSLRYFSSPWFQPLARQNALSLTQNRDFNLGKII